MGPGQLASNPRPFIPKHPFTYKTEPLCQLAKPRLFVKSRYVPARAAHLDVKLASILQVRAD